MQKLPIYIWMIQLIILSACNSSTLEEEIPSVDERDAIGFAAKVQNSRAIADLDAVKNDEDGFAVWGGYDKNNVFNGESVIYKDGFWDYGTPKYWVLDKIYNFYALYPASLGTSNSDGSFTINNYNLKDNSEKEVANRTDLIKASVLNMDSNNPTTVNLNFTHMLTQVEVCGKIEDGAGNVSVNNVKIYGIPNKANYTDIESTWNTTELSTSTNVFYSKESDIPLSTTSTDVFGGALWVAPLLTNQCVISITYTQNNTTKTKDIYPLAYTSGGWQAGQKYRYTFTVIDDGTILFDTPKITPWLNANGSIIIID